jgi:hypothetical protein
VSSIRQAAIATSSLKLVALIGLLECAAVRSDAACRARIVGWLR